MMTMFQPNDGFRFEIGLPISQQFQTQFSWSFSNKKAPEFELMSVVMAGGQSMMEDEMSMIQASSTSAGRATAVIQKPLPYGCKLSIQTDCGGDDPNVCMSMFTLQKDFANSHIQYQYQGVHMVSYMQSISETLSAGYSMGFVPQHNRSLFSYGAKWQATAKTMFLATYNAAHPQEKILLAMVSRPSKRLALFAELKAGPDNKTEYLGGYRMNFSEGAQITGSLTSGLKAVTVYRKMIEMFSITMTGSIDFSKPTAPATFGVALSLGGM